MAYSDLALLVRDQDFSLRSQACYAVETVSNPDAIIPEQWWGLHAWDMAAQPGFADAYAYALAQTPPIERPGNDPGVITDGMILSGVQSVNAVAAQAGQ